MTPSITRFLLEGAELLNQESNSVDRLMQYLDENLINLSDGLNDDNFQSMLTIIWEKVAKILYDIVETNLEKRRPPSFFSNLFMTLQILMNFFKKGEKDHPDEYDSSQGSILDKVTHLLRLHGLETGELIHQYHIERAESQEGCTQQLGLLTVQAHFIDSMLRIVVMNGRNLRPKDTNSSCDPYVKIAVMPEEKYSSLPKPKSKTHKKTTFPLFDEVYTFPLTSEQRRFKEGLVHFSVKDSDFLGTEFLGECFLKFASIEETDNPHTLPQIHLPLTKPSGLESDALKALEHRQGDKQAKEFLKKLRAKMPQ